MKKWMIIFISLILFFSFTTEVSASPIKKQTDFSYMVNRNVDIIKSIGNGTVSVSVKKRKGTYAYIAIEKSKTARVYQIPEGKIVRVPLMFGKGTYHIYLGYSKSNKTDISFRILKEKKVINRYKAARPYSFIILGTKSPQIKSLLKTEFKGYSNWSSKTKVTKVRDYFAKKYYYSDTLANYVDKYWYNPDYKARIKDKGVICYDVAAITASLLRVMKVPTRFIGGYWKGDKKTYHAWNEVYINGKWHTVDNTFDLRVKLDGDWIHPKEPVFEKASDYIKMESF